MLGAHHVSVLHSAANEKPLKGKKDTSDLEYSLLIRATDGKKKKISTVVKKENLIKFKDSYDTILKVGTLV